MSRLRFRLVWAAILLASVAAWVAVAFAAATAWTWAR